MTDDYAWDNVWHMASCLLGNCCLRLASHGEDISLQALLAELKKMKGAFSPLPGGEYLPLRLAIEQLELSIADELR
ncbi:hypothetical protein [Erwinia sp. QL-Z3]|uniref:hypothetical protein n=1 Tax=Erwinia sp. QL-Z3 TaxID=2547962 RepID=UPI001070D4EA|nr:hypothetical protein [Erwinia sp. QL-Z3]QBR48562.1 hypothetical protein E2F51_00515 [Erwinia sp. QL-Z3]